MALRGQREAGGDVLIVGQALVQPDRADAVPLASEVVDADPRLIGDVRDVHPNVVGDDDAVVQDVLNSMFSRRDSEMVSSLGVHDHHRPRDAVQDNAVRLVQELRQRAFDLV